MARLSVAIQTRWSRPGAVTGQPEEFSRLWEVRVAFALLITRQRCAGAERHSDMVHLNWTRGPG